jgi:hypothetical protein
MNDLQPSPKFSSLFQRKVEGLPSSVRSNKILDDFVIPAACFQLSHSNLFARKKIRVNLRIFVMVVLELALRESPFQGVLRVREYFLMDGNMKFIDILAERVRLNSANDQFKLFQITARPRIASSGYLVWEDLASYLQFHFLIDLEVLGSWTEELDFI